MNVVVLLKNGKEKVFKNARADLLHPQLLKIYRNEGMKVEIANFRWEDIAGWYYEG